MALTANAAAAAPVRLCRDEVDAAGIRAVAVNSGNANASTGEQGMQGRASRCGTPPPRRSGLEAARGRDRRDRHDRRARSTSTRSSPGSARRPARSQPSGGADFTRAIMTTDRGPKQCTLRAGGVTVSAQAKGAGMIEPGFATMLCFVQTDAVVEDPDAALRPRWPARWSGSPSTAR